MGLEQDRAGPQQLDSDMRILRSVEQLAGFNDVARALMSTLDVPVGPALIVTAWAGSLIAFAWEALLHLTEQLCASRGQDDAGRPFSPGYVAADRGVLFVQPVGRA